MSGKGLQSPRAKGNTSKPKEGQCEGDVDTQAGKPFEKKVKSSLLEHLTLPMALAMGCCGHGVYIEFWQLNPILDAL